MPPENYCYWCSDIHPGRNCKQHADEIRQFRIDNPHSCAQCRSY